MAQNPRTTFADSGSSPPDTTSSARLDTPGPKTLHLGVVVVPYRAKGRKSTGITTGDVAQILEAKYGLMAAFARVHQTDIANAIENSTQGALEALIMGKKLVDPYGRGMQNIQQSFRDFINSREAENIGIPGTPTAAALNGVSHRVAHPYAKKNSRRPSFRDTGLLSASMRAWITP